MSVEYGFEGEAQPSQPATRKHGPTDAQASPRASLQGTLVTAQAKGATPSHVSSSHVDSSLLSAAARPVAAAARRPACSTFCEPQPLPAPGPVRQAMPPAAAAQVTASVPEDDLLSQALEEPSVAAALVLSEALEEPSEAAALGPKLKGLKRGGRRSHLDAVEGESYPAPRRVPRLPAAKRMPSNLEADSSLPEPQYVPRSTTHRPATRRGTIDSSQLEVQSSLAAGSLYPLTQRPAARRGSVERPESLRRGVSSGSRSHRRSSDLRKSAESVVEVARCDAPDVRVRI